MLKGNSSHKHPSKKLLSVFHVSGTVLDPRDKLVDGSCFQEAHIFGRMGHWMGNGEKWPHLLQTQLPPL